jgi:Icc-related predicted phosphoesterase
MIDRVARRQFLQLAGVGAGAVFASGLPGFAEAAGLAKDFYFVQLSDTHWGYDGPANPDATGTLPKAIAAVNALKIKPDFIVFTGDLTHTTDDAAERDRRMTGFREQISALKIKDVRFLAGEHDASLDKGEAFQRHFGPTHWAFAHKGVQFIALDNVSDPSGAIGDEQLAWFKAELDKHPKDARIVVLTHRPLFDLFPDWDWFTRDGSKALELIAPYSNLTVFYGHIHQEHHQTISGISHHAAKSLIFPLPKPGSQPKRAPIPWDPAQPYRGLGFRSAEDQPRRWDLTEYDVQKKA